MKCVVGVLLVATFCLAQEPILPPVAPFSGKSRSVVLPRDHKWATPCERSGLKHTPRYAETVAWLRKLCDADPAVRMVTLGKSAEGREIVMVIAGDPAKHPTLFVHAGIHSGEIDGKDAGMMLLRDMTVRGWKRSLLDKAALLFVPILSVDGHERFGPYSRVNQRGPEQMGWRTNARNLNLNRDFAKLDTAGVRAAVSVLNKWKPDLYLDIHVTDGADYQYDITWGSNGPHAHSPEIAVWLREVFGEAARMDLRSKGHVPGPLVFLDERDTKKGNPDLTFGPRYSNGYGDLRHLPSVLVENHSLKPYDQRVLGTYVLIESALKTLAAHGAVLREAVQKDRASRREIVPLAFSPGTKSTVKFLAIEQRLEPSKVTGGKRVVWTGKPLTLEIPWIVHDKVKLAVKRPKAYWVPAAWHDVIARLKLHGIEMERIEDPREVAVELDRVVSFELGKEPYEGRVRVDKAEFKLERRRERYPAGSVRVSTDQPLGDLAIALLDPRGRDSFFAWGFFPGILQRTEYIENYVIEPMAERMLAENLQLKKAYEKKLTEDAEFAKDPAARRQWFYERTPYFDRRWRLYPVGRE